LYFQHAIVWATPAWYCPEFFAHLVGLSGTRTGSSGDGTFHLLVLQLFNIQIAFARPRGAGDVAQPGRGEIESRLPVREGADHGSAPPDLAQNALERIVGADATPMLLGKRVLGECFLDRRFHELGGLGQPQPES
jgi:hypothetical protein